MNLRRSIKLKFDRSFSGASIFKQLFWLLILVVMTCLMFLALKPYDTSAWEVVEVYLDPGNFSNAVNYRWYGLLVVIGGSIFFSSMLISVLSNILERRIEAVRNGEVFYHFENHVIIMGNDEMVAGIIKKVVAQDTQCDILLQTQQEVVRVAQNLHTQLSKEEEKRLTIVSARRDSLEDLAKMRIKKAKEVYILGEEGECESDALTLNSLKYIAQIATDDAPIKCITQLRYQSTFTLFQTTDLPEQIKRHVDFHPFNFNESWARKLFIENHNFDNSIKYKPLDYESITADSRKRVHLVIIGMTPMGIALAVEAARICHFPNFSTQGVRTKITFIDTIANREMEYFIGRHRPLLSLSSYSFRKFTDGVEEVEKRKIHSPSPIDFLDIEWEFIEGSIATEAIQNEIDDWARNDDELLTIACCFEDSAQNIAVGFYLPKSMYETTSGTPSDIPILVKQSLCGDIAEVLQNSSRYKEVKPFGMTNEGYDEQLDRVKWAKRVNHIYLEGEVPEIFITEKIEEQWGRCSITDKWSNIYNAISIPTKLRSMGIMLENRDSISEPTKEKIALMANVEHNRWNTEKLLAGYIPTSDEQNREIEDEFQKMSNGKIEISKDTIKKRLNRKHHIHYDIRPSADLRNDETGTNVNRSDILLSKGIIKIIN